MLADDVLFSSVAELGERLRTRQISPLELTASYLERLERLGPDLGAVITVTRDLAMRQAAEAEKEILAGRYRGSLHGIPYGAKDLLATRGIPTTWGAAPYRDQVFDYDATCIERLRRAGAIIAGKLAMVELAGGLGYNNPDASFTGPGRTPWNTAFWSGGSSSGSGAATSAALVGFAIGSETSGSILTPVACCGITGLRPTYGLVSRHGAMALCWTLDKLGPMCRSAEDCGLVLAAIAGRDAADPTTLDRPFVFPPRERRTLPRTLRLGVPRGVLDRVQPEVRSNFEAAIEVLRDFAAIVDDVELPDFPGVVGTIVRAEGAAAFRDLIESGRTRELQNPKDRIGGFSMMMTPAVDYLHAMRLRAPMRRAYMTLWQKVDGLLAPTRGSVAPPIGVDFDAPPSPPPGSPGVRDSRPPTPNPAAALIPTTNAIGAPAIAFPNGFGQHGLPTSIQIMGPPFSELILVTIAEAYQQRTDWHRRPPPLSAPSAQRALAASSCAWEERL
jgi:aspartyl-tRNA(Asn)/glutamyl-tRNA(Gln) amidotransferase subunit A